MNNLKQNAEKLTNEQLLEVVEDFKNGMSLNDIKNKYDASPKQAIKRAKQLMKTMN